MSDLIKKLSRAAKRREGCRLSPEMVRELVNMRTIRRHIEVERRPPPPRAIPVTVTTKMIRQIRDMKAANPKTTNKEIAIVVGCSISTVQRYVSEGHAEIAREREAERYRQNKERINQAALARYYAKKEAAQCSI
ncbi:hypothetical protein EVC02_012 [Rhizobium phage RHph_N17]|nr:hypothetical protein EVC02_012 [Rhizobium phage RHph_N17]